MNNPRIFTLALLLAAVATLPACGLSLSSVVDPFHLLTPAPTTTTQPDTQAATRIPTNIASHGLRLRMYKITVPLGAFSLNDKLWRLVNEDTLDSQTSVLLAQNGLRAGTGPLARWATIAKLIDIPGASTQEFFCQTDGRTPLLIPTRANIPQQSVFYVDKDLNMQGRTFDKCDNAIRLSMTRIKNSSDIQLQLEPVVELGTITVIRNPQDVGVTRMSVPQEETFANLRLATTVKTDTFLIIAPANPKTNEFSVGTRFLSDSDQIPSLETILVFVPFNEK